MTTKITSRFEIFVWCMLIFCFMFASFIAGELFDQYYTKTELDLIMINYTEHIGFNCERNYTNTKIEGDANGIIRDMLFKFGYEGIVKKIKYYNVSLCWAYYESEKDEIIIYDCNDDYMPLDQDMEIKHNEWLPFVLNHEFYHAINCDRNQYNANIYAYKKIHNLE